MSVSSATTLISPAATTSTTTTNTTSNHTMQRSHSHHGHKARTASHHHHGHGHGHAGKRRPSAHAAHTTGHIGAGIRRGSEGEGGRKAAFANLAMHTMDDKDKGKGRKSQEERPQPKSSRSDSTLLRRTTSTTSNTSSQHGTGSRPRLKDKESENSVVVVDDKGREIETEDAEDEEWDDEEAAEEEQGKSDDKDPMSQAMRRTVSETATAVMTQSPQELSVKPASITSPVSSTKSRPELPSLTTRKTTGFSGKHPEPEPEPIEPVPLRRVQSVKELAAEAIGSERKITAHKLAVLDREREHEQERQNSGPTRTRSTEGSGLPKNLTQDQKAVIETSPSYPFPRVLDQPAPESSTMAQRSTSGSGQGPYPLRHRPSNTSLRSTASYRAPPHPLNHAGGHSRTASTALSPGNSDMRSMHQPPLAPPVINTEAAAGHSWDIPEHQEVSSMRPPAPMNRRESTSSQRSLRAIFQPTSSRMQMTSRSTSNGTAPPPSQNGPVPHRRPTAMEAASAASRLHTTNNPALYHQSLGYSTASAETAHLISRFLPPKKSTKPSWIITPEMMQDGQPHIGITEGDYRDAHDSLLRQMREMGTGSSSSMAGGVGSRKSGNRITSSLLSVGQGSHSAVGVIKSRNGPLDVTRGSWRGKSPFDLSVERCLAQRPRAPGM